MNSRILRRSGIGWSALVAILAVAMLGSYLQTIRDIDGRVFDSFRRALHVREVDSSILVVQCDPSVLDRDNPGLERLLKLIDGCMPKAIGVVSDRADFGVDPSIVGSLQHPLIQGMPAWSIEAEQQSETGFSELSFEPQLVFRDSQHRVDVDGRRLCSFEFLLASESQERPIPNKGLTGVNFGNALRSFPTIDGEQILSGNYLPEMIKGSLVIVGEALPEQMGVFTPVSRTIPMSRLEVRGHVIRTLLVGNGIYRANSWWGFVCIVCVWVVCVLVFRVISNRMFPFVAACLAIAVLLACFLVLVVANACLPVTAMLFLALAVPVCAGFLRYRMIAEALAFWRTRLGAQAATVSQQKGQSAWELISMSAGQLFGPSRLVLFELEPGHSRMSLVLTEGCGADSILERRRDISRDPWQGFIESGLPGKHSGRPIFDRVERKENSEAENRVASVGGTEFIVPLLVQGTIFGFMVLEMNTASLRNWKDFENVLKEFSFEITRIVAHNRSAEAGAKLESSWRHRILHVPESIEFEKIERQQRAIAVSWSQIEQSFEANSGCRVLFDAYGRVLKLNSKMIRSVESGQAISESSFVELVPRIASVNTAVARQLMRKTLILGQRCEFTTNASRIDGKVILSPVAWGDNDGEMLNRGVLLEVFDRTQSEESAELDHVLGQLVTLQTTLTFAMGATDSHARSAVAEIVTDLSTFLSRDEKLLPQCNGTTFERVWRVAEFNARPALQKSNLMTEFRVEDGNAVVLPDAKVVGYGIETCLSVMSEICSNGTLLIDSIQTEDSWTLKFRNRLADLAPRHEFSSPGILGTRQTDMLFDVRLMMKSCGGALDVEDNSNGEAVFHLTFPVVQARETTCV